MKPLQTITQTYRKQKITQDFTYSDLFHNFTVVAFKFCSDNGEAVPRNTKPHEVRISWSTMTITSLWLDGVKN